MVNEKGIIIDRREMLRIKLMSLAAEARIIKKEERRMPVALAGEMHRHRIRRVRAEARDTHVALGFLRGRAYAQLEPIHYTDPEWKQVLAMVQKYGYFQQVQKYGFFQHSKDVKLLEEMITYWHEHPTWIAPSFKELQAQREALHRDRLPNESLKDYWENQPAITLESLIRSRMVA